MARDVLLLIGTPPFQEVLVASELMEQADAPAAALALGAKHPGAKVLVVKVVRVFGVTVTLRDEALL